MAVSGIEIAPDSGGSPLTDILFNPGSWKDTNSANAFTLDSSLVKELDNVWAVGTAAGGRASGSPYIADTWYHVFMIAKPDGTVDAGFDTDITAVNLLADATDYTLFRRIGAIKTEQGSVNIIPFYNKISVYSGQREFYWIGIPTGSVFNVTDPPNLTPANFVVLTPFDVEVKAIVSCHVNLVGGPGDGEVALSVISPQRAPAFVPRSINIHNSGPGVSSFDANDFSLYTNLLSELIYELERLGSANGAQVEVITNGWIE